MIKYFISSFCEVGSNQCFRNFQALSQKPITDFEDLLKLSDDICKKEKLDSIVILNWKRFEQPL